MKTNKPYILFPTAKNEKMDILIASFIRRFCAHFSAFSAMVSSKIQT